MPMYEKHINMNFAFSSK